MRIALLVPDGVGVRNFILGKFLRFASEKSEVHTFHIIPDDLLPAMAASLNGKVKWHPLIPYRQSKLALLLQYSLGYAQMYWADTQSMRRIREQLPSSLRMKTFARGARLIGRWFASPERMQALDRRHCRIVRRLPETEHYKRTFRETRPTILFCSHQRPSVVLPAVLAAQALGIPTATFIFSWDNITSKGRIIAPFDHYLVWSNHMKRELLQYYPHIPEQRIHLVGTPQFEAYADTSLLWTREEFFERIQADTSRPLICYSGGDAGTCPEDQEHVRVLMELVRAGRIRRNPQVIVRAAPVDDGKRYQRVRDLFPELIFAQPKWLHTQMGNWASVIPSAEDVQFLANLTHHADLNVNLGSTMTLDFGLQDKPVVNIAFDVANPPIFGMPLWDFYYCFEHFRPVVELKAARFARSAQQLADHINVYLDNPSLDRQARKGLCDLQVGVPPGQSNRRILEVLESIQK